MGVTFDSKSSFNSHVDAIVKKANSTRAFLSRNLKGCSQKIKAASYTTYVRPTVEYAAAAWDPHTQRNTKKLEQVQQNAARYVLHDYDHRSDVTIMLQNLKWEPLDERRKQSCLAMLYYIMAHVVDINW